MNNKETDLFFFSDDVVDPHFADPAGLGAHRCE